MPATKDKKDARQKALKALHAFHKKHKRLPYKSELKEAGTSWDALRHHFGGIVGASEAYAKAYPTKDRVSVLDVLKESKAKIAHTKQATKRFVLTTAVVGCEADPGFLKCLETYCNTNGAELMLLVTADPAAKASPGGLGYLDSTLTRFPVVAKDTNLNRNIMLSGIAMSAKQIDPGTGLTRLVKRGASMIYASPKQRLAYSATMGQQLPTAVMGTGAVTKPSYGSARYMSQRTAYLAHQDHVMGAVVVELADDKIFHFRQLQYRDGVVVDLGKVYGPRTTGGFPTESLVLGDWHTGETDSAVAIVTEDLIKKLDPGGIFLHDFFNGRSINHHNRNRQMTRAALAAKRIDLKQELQQTADELSWFLSFGPEIYVVESNHDRWLMQYLESGDWVSEPHNYHRAVELACHVSSGRNPLQEAVDPDGHAYWLNRDTSLRLRGVEHAAHGDLGNNGARASERSLEIAHGDCTVGHTHVPGIYRGVYHVGTSTPRMLPWMMGPSGWLNTHCAMYANGARQLINVIEGGFTI